MRAIIGYAALVGLLAIAPVACEERPARPSAPSVPGTPTSLEIRGTTRLYRPGDTGQLMPVAVFASGTRMDATTLAPHFSIPEGSAVAVMRDNGYWEATGYGRTTVQLTCKQQWSASTEITVLPEGMFMLSGRVTQGSLQVPVPQAKVEFVMPAQSFTTVTDGAGRYALPALGAGILRVEATNYGSESRSLSVNGDTAAVDVVLNRASDAFTDTYLLTFTASASCSLPAAVATRQYVATVQDSSTNLVVHLSGANFIQPYWGGPGFTGTRNGNAVRFVIGGSDTYSDYLFIEDLGNNQWLRFDGQATGTISAGQLSTIFSGTVTWTTASTSTLCAAADHRLEFTR